MNTVHLADDITLTAEHERLLVGASPTWANEREVEVDVVPDGERYAFVYTAKFGTAEWGVIFNPHTGRYSASEGFIGENEGLSLADLVRVADDLQQLIAHLRRHAVTA